MVYAHIRKTCLCTHALFILSNHSLTPTHIHLLHTLTPSHTSPPHTRRPVNLEVSLPPMEGHVDFTAHFPQGCQAANCLQGKVNLPCTLEFSSSQPVSRTDYITFSDKTTGKRWVCVSVESPSNLRCITCSWQLLHS